ncbi:hypothetical protein K490DRAFT_30800 [Saccharata proteae CBS 121410]|uniref:Uncharacterized protein n=1 Tax=Saccharata proteae CBS 121410 TaxID=1314787 RepID=A0A9P4I304_9PEZI|nr:hypothetical protein K490DRAFT_30800 [Saccharata proteae CBS 121410]
MRHGPPKDVPSSVYTMLPALIQSRIPRLQSLRRTVTDFRTRPQHSRCASEPVPGAETSPPPAYTSRPSSAAMRRGSGASDGDTVQSIPGDTLVDDRPSSSSTALPEYRPSDMQTGVNWKYANQGLNLLNSALHEYSSLSKDPSSEAAPFSRQLYMHAVTYLLRGLPSDLNAEERLSLETALPANTIKVFQVDAASGQLVRSYNHQAPTEPQQPPPEPSWLHRILASSIVQLFLFLHLILPYVKLFIGHAYQYERQHRISEKFVSSSISTVDELGRRGIKFTNAVCQMNDGKVGQAINDLTLWWLRGVTGGIHDGVSEGVMLLGAREDTRVVAASSPR